MAIDEGRFKQAMSHFVSGVTVVTTEHEGQKYGLTVASFASLSLNPPLVLICIGSRMKSHDAIADSRRFGVSMLAAEQQHLSAHFGSKLDDKFASVAHHSGNTGVPLIDGALCTLECRVQEQLRGGDHSIFVGEVVEAEVREGAPLVYWKSGYRELA